MLNKLFIAIAAVAFGVMTATTPMRTATAAESTDAASPNAAAPAADSAPKTSACFNATEWHGWRAAGPDVIYLRIGVHDFYRIDLVDGSTTLQWPDARLISHIRGSNWICSPLDLDLSVSDSAHFREPLFIKSITALSSEEAAAIPKEFRP